jgi:chaperonin cofactor prefoldin
MDKILKIEAQMQDGKALDEEQKIMYTTKSNVEKSLADLKAILTAFEEIPKEVGM